jgi:CDP-glucose 4,6-dehydratase
MKTIFGDVRELSVVREVFAKSNPSVVLHLAAQALVRRSYREPVETYATNVMGTVHILDAIRTLRSVEAAVIVTSDKCYENRGWIWGYRENERLGGRDPYSNSKGCAELVTSAYRDSYFSSKDACRVASGRAGNVIGGGDWSEDRLIPDMVRHFTKHEPVEIRSPGATRPWQHVLEPLSGYLKLIEALAECNGNNFAEGWNFGPDDDDCVPVSYIADKLVSLWGENVTWRLGETDPSLHEAHLLKVDASKAKSRLAWRPKLRIDEALAWSIDLYKRQLAGEDAWKLMMDQITQYEAR